jgi:hypothetical protein
MNPNHTGERDLGTLLQQMTPSVHPEVFVFCCFADGQLPGRPHPGLHLS